MKKILAVVLSLAMILSMTVCAFAEDVEDVVEWTSEMYEEYYVEVLENDLLDDEAKVETIMATTQQDVSFLEYQIASAIETARADGKDVENVVVLLNEALRESWNKELESALGEDIDGDGYLGNPADGNLYKPTDPTDVEAWTTYYVVIFAQAATNPSAMLTVISEIADDITSEAISLDTFLAVLPEASAQVGTDVVNQVLWGVETLLETDANADGYIGKPDEQLPEEDEGDSALSGMLDTILGILGSIINSLFNPDNGSGDPVDPGEPSDPWPEPDPNGNNGSTIPGTGDTTVFAVAAVALAAGAALVMTRKKSEDAE